MSLFVQRAEYALRAAKQLGIKDRAAFQVISPELTPVIIIADARDSMNNPSERRALTFASQAAVAAQFASVELVNPGGSGCNIIVDEVHVTSSTNSMVTYRITSAGILLNLVANANQYRDPIPGQPLAQTRAESLVAFVDGAGRIRVNATDTFVLNVKWVLRGDPINPIQLRFTNNGANNDLFCTFLYREIFPGDPLG